MQWIQFLKSSLLTINYKYSNNEENLKVVLQNHNVLALQLTEQKKMIFKYRHKNKLLLSQFDIRTIFKFCFVFHGFYA